jgi:O-antigen biosynthesis protein
VLGRLLKSVRGLGSAPAKAVRGGAGLLPSARLPSARLPSARLPSAPRLPGLGRLPRRRNGGSPQAAVWLNESLLLVICDLGEGRGDVRAETVANGDKSPVAVASHRFRRFEQGGQSSVETLAVLELAAGEGWADADRVVLSCGGRSVVLGQAELQAAPREAGDELRSRLSPLQAATRRALRELLLEAARPHLEGPDAGTLANNLRRLRDVLRERGRDRVSSQDEPLNHDVDRIMAVDDRAFWVRGWIRDEKGAATALTAISPEGFSAELLAGAFRHHRPDIEQAYGSSGMETAEKHGLMSYFELAAPSRIGTGWVTKLETAGGGGVEGGTPEVVADFAAVRELILRDTKEDGFDHELTERHAHPALSRMQERLRRSVKVETVIEYGSAPASPPVTVIVPLYGRIDFVQHQIAQFVRDPEFAGLDLVYVLDSPELARDLNHVASGLHEFYELPFRVAILSRNGGFSIANNLGASVARGRTLLLLNSDVLPSRPHWVSRLSAFYDATPNIGALGTKLLYEDNSLQHAGMYFRLEPETLLWGNQHYLKGFARNFAPANVARPVPALTGACMMIDRALYEEVGGLDHGFVQGGYEDSDLCLRLIRLGRQNWYLPQVELYHLEQQSFPTADEYRWLATRYNTWLQTHRWRGLIGELMSAQPSAQPAPAAVTA